MMENREDLADVIATICPHDASDQAMLFEASEVAAERVVEMMPALRERAAREVWAPDPDYVRRLRHEHLAGIVAKTARAIRNDYLKEHGAFRG